MPKQALKTKKNSLEIFAGSFPPSTQIKGFNDTQWEEFIETCCLLDKDNRGPYKSVKRLGSSGDGGRDVEARLIDDLKISQWDLYQAKHYKNPLSPSNFFPELAKFFWQLGLKTYPRPRFYLICAPCNTGSDLHDLLANPTSFKERFLKDWKEGKTGLKDKSSWMTKEALEEVANFDFSNIKEILVREFLEIHSTDETAHFATFKITPVRGDDPSAPVAPESYEEVYLSELIKVYEEHSGSTLNLAQVMALEEYCDHLTSSRNEFYCAEGLKRFSRDIFPEEFERLLTMVYQGVRTTLNSPKHTSGLDRLDAVTNLVSTLKFNDSKLNSTLRPGDLPGSCHHLVNDRKFKWVKQKI